MKRKLGWLVIGLAAGLSASAQAEIETLKTTYSDATVWYATSPDGHLIEGQ